MLIDEGALTDPSLTALTLPQRAAGSSLLRNSAYIMGTTIATSALGYLYWTLAARSITPYQVGLASTLLSAMTMISTVSSLGMGPALVQTLPKRLPGKDWSLTLTTGLAAVGVAGAITGVLVVFLLPLFLPQFAFLSAQPLAAGALVVGVVMTSLASVLDQTFVAERSSIYMLVRNAGFALLKLVVLAGFVFLLAGGALSILLSWVGATALTAALALLVLVPRLRRRYRPTLAGAGARLRAMARLMTGNQLAAIGSLAPMLLLPMFVSIRLSVTESAYFYTTWMVAGVVFMITPSVAAALFAEGSHDPERVVRQARKSLAISSALFFPALAVFLVGGGLILSIFGPGYAEHGEALLVILVLAGIPDGITNIYGSVLLVRQRVFADAALNLGMAILALAGAWVLLPDFGLAGAGLAWLLAQSIGCVACGIDAGLGAMRAKRAMVPWPETLSDREARWMATQDTSRLAPSAAEEETILRALRAERETVRLAPTAEQETMLLRSTEMRETMRLAPSHEEETRRLAPHEEEQETVLLEHLLMEQHLSAIQETLPIGAVSALRPPTSSAGGRDQPRARRGVLIGGIHVVIITTLLVALALAHGTPQVHLNLDPVSTAQPGVTSPIATASVPQAPALRVTAIKASVAPTVWAAPCGARFVFAFHATITVTKSLGGTISYTWFRSNGTSSSGTLIVPSGATTVSATDTWTVGSGTPNGAAYEYVQVTAPNVVTSSHAVFRVAC